MLSLSPLLADESPSRSLKERIAVNLDVDLRTARFSPTRKHCSRVTSRCTMSGTLSVPLAFLSVAQRESLGECTVPSSVARSMLRNRGIHCDRKVLQKDHVDASRDAPVQLRYG